MVVKGFSQDLTAAQTTEFVGISRNAANRLYSAIWRRIVEYNRPGNLALDKYEVDESCFGPQQVKRKRSHKTSSKIIIFGLYECDGMVYTEIVLDCKSATVQTIIRGYADIEIFDS